MAVSSEDGQENLQRCYDRLYSTLLKHMQYALLASNKVEANRRLMTSEMWRLMVANSCHEQIKLILKLFLDPRVIPYERQYLMGKRVWTCETFSKSGRIDLDEISSMLAGLWGVYRIRVLVNGFLFQYSGSSVSMDGWSCRWLTHRDTIALGSEEIVRRRQSASTEVLFIHFLCSLPGAVWSIHEVARFPLLHFPPKVVWLLKHFIHLFESVLMVFEGNLDGNYKCEFPGHSRRARWDGRGTELLAKALSPADAPEISHKGANRALAMSQCCSKVTFNNQEETNQWKQIYEILRDVFQATKSNYLSAFDCINTIKIAESRYGIVLQNSHKLRLKLRSCYRVVLKKHDVPPGDAHDGRLHQLYPLLVVLKQQLEENGWVSKKPIDGFYQISRRRFSFDWEQISKKTQAIAKESKREFYTPERCCATWRELFSKGRTILGRLLLFESNWEKFTSESPSSESIPRLMSFRMRIGCSED